MQVCFASMSHAVCSAAAWAPAVEAGPAEDRLLCKLIMSCYGLSNELSHVQEQTRTSAAAAAAAG